MYSDRLDEWLECQNYEYGLASGGTKSKPFVGARKYLHLDGYVTLQDLQSNTREDLLNVLRDPNLLARHKFLPFARKDTRQRRFLSVWAADGAGVRRTPQVKIKVRPLMYASHRDAVIYGFYAWMLKGAYEEMLKSEPEVSRAVIAYRKIARIPGGDKGKSNIDFALEVKEYVDAHPGSVVLCLDVSNFFGSLNHDYLSRQVASILGKGTVPPGFDTVLKSLTRFRYFYRRDLLLETGKAKEVRGRLRYVKTEHPERVLASPSEFNALEKATRRTSHPLVIKNEKPAGIPQGSPMSDILANLYMYVFDRELIDHLAASSRVRFYRRYSDDILIVCDRAQAANIYEFAKTKSGELGLVIKDSKTEAYAVDDVVRDVTYEITGLPSHMHNDKKTVRYLGFEFDTEDIHIRSATVAKHYRRTLYKARKRPARKRVVKDKVDIKTRKRDYMSLAHKRTASRRIGRQVQTIRRRDAILRTAASRGRPARTV